MAFAMRQYYMDKKDQEINFMWVSILIFQLSHIQTNERYFPIVLQTGQRISTRTRKHPESLFISW